MSGPEESKLPHEPVLYQEIIHALRPQRAGKYVDGTLGAGGHAWGILQVSGAGGRLLGLDVDPQALAMARQRLAEYGERAIVVQASYTELSAQLAMLGWEAVDGILLDLGASSMQFDTAERGFSFQADGPLDMRFSPENPVTAADLVNDLPESELADLIYRYGEERRSRQIARALVQARPLQTTSQLAETIAKAAGGRSKAEHIHPATRTFQALRIAVNEELQAIEQVLPQAVAALAPGGRLAVIAFHSLEDRIVKQYFRRESQDCICPPEQPVCICDHKASIEIITRRPIGPAEAEAQANPRARSARLRVAEKLAVEA
ncbi:MAG: 16S rRNA (cytosine(1402)-N(4))-methyltransferase RsmH [Anaerolineales bacterium]|nr:16S rRNA (cytosine(1402)-N(4))-methyltransferase RsmH [Anaerolineales bacterium]